MLKAQIKTKFHAIWPCRINLLTMCPQENVMTKLYNTVILCHIKYKIQHCYSWKYHLSILIHKHVFSNRQFFLFYSILILFYQWSQQKINSNKTNSQHFMMHPPLCKCYQQKEWEQKWYELFSCSEYKIILETNKNIFTKCHA